MDLPEDVTKQGKYWRENLQYVLQFRMSDGREERE